MNATKRLKNLLEGKETERPLVSMWKHFPIIDRNIDAFIQRTIEFQEEFDWDFIKVCHNGLYSIEDWGSTIKWPKVHNEVGVVTDYYIKDASQWNKLKKLSIDEGALKRELLATKGIVEHFKGEVPVIPTIFSPLTTAIKMTGDTIFRHMKEEPEALHKGLEIITDVTIDFVVALIKLGVDGFFFATQLGTFDRLSYDIYKEFGVKYDLPVLEPAQGKTWFNILHMHGNDPMFDELKDYPVEAINWHDRKVDIILSEARMRTDKILIGGIDEHGVLRNAKEGELKEHIEDALAQAPDGRIILGPGCVVPLDIPETRLGLLKHTVKQIGDTAVA